MLSSQVKFSSDRQKDRQTDRRTDGHRYNNMPPINRCGGIKNTHAQTFGQLAYHRDLTEISFETLLETTN